MHAAALHGMHECRPVRPADSGELLTVRAGCSVEQGCHCRAQCVSVDASVWNHPSSSAGDRSHDACSSQVGDTLSCFRQHSLHGFLVRRVSLCRCAVVREVNAKWSRVRLRTFKQRLVHAAAVCRVVVDACCSEAFHFWRGNSTPPEYHSAEYDRTGRTQRQTSNANNGRTQSNLVVIAAEGPTPFPHTSVLRSFACSALAVCDRRCNCSDCSA